MIENVDEVTHFTGEECSKQKIELESQSFGFSEAFEPSTHGHLEPLVEQIKPKQIVDDALESQIKAQEDEALK